MTQILHLDASHRDNAWSHSRRVSADFIAAWKAAHPHDTVTFRDLGHEPVPGVTGDWIAGIYSPPEAHTPEQAKAVAYSDALVKELFDADIYVFGVPMYNFSVPGPFKSYIDQIVRPGRTILFEPNAAPKGGLTGKKLIVLTASGFGDYGPGEASDQINLHAPYIRAIFGFIGVTDVTFINADNTGRAMPDASATGLKAEIERVVSNAQA